MQDSTHTKLGHVFAYMVGGAFTLFGIMGLLIEFNKERPSSTNFYGYTIGALFFICGALTCIGVRLHYRGGLWSFCGLILIAAAIVRITFGLQTAMQGRHIIVPVPFYSSIVTLWVMGCYCLIYGHIRRYRKRELSK